MWFLWIKKTFWNIFLMTEDYLYVLSESHFRVFFVQQVWMCLCAILWGRLVAGRGRFRLHDAFDNRLGVLETCEHLLGTAVLFNKWKFECSVVALFVDVCDSTHDWTNNDLGVVVKEVDLKNRHKENQDRYKNSETTFSVVEWLTWIVPLDKCKMMAFLVLNQVLKNGRRDISSPGRGAILAPAFKLKIIFS